jgi:hypothetical protein
VWRAVRGAPPGISKPYASGDSGGSWHDLAVSSRPASEVVRNG